MIFDVNDTFRLRGDVSEESQTEWISEDPYNGSYSTELPIDMRFNDGHKLSIIVYGVLMAISSIGNITVLILLINRRLRGPSRVDIMLMHLAIADLLVTFLMMPLEIGWALTVSWRAGDLMCKVMAFFRTFGLYLSSFVLVCISLDRYFAVLKPLHISDTRGRFMILIAWIAASVCSAPQAAIFTVQAHPNITWYKQCITYNFYEDEFPQTIYSILVMVFMYAVPLTIIIVCYASIYLEIYSKSKKIITDLLLERFRRSNDDVLSRAKRRTLRMTITIVIVFVVCWTPYYVMCIWYWVHKESAREIDQRIQKGLFLFACTNSCMNPIVYGIFNIRPKKYNRYNTVTNNRNASISRRLENGDCSGAEKSQNGRGSRGSIGSTLNSNKMLNEKVRTNSNIKRTICISCGDSIELTKLKNHSLYH